MSRETQRYGQAIHTWLTNFGGKAFSRDVRRWVATPTRQDTTGDVTEWLTRPVTAKVKCDSGEIHAITVTADGTVEFPDHPITDLDSECLLIALGGSRVPPCLTVYAVAHDQLDTVATAREHVDQSLVRAWQMYLTARTWAADPTVYHHPTTDRAIFLETGTTPDLWKPYAAAGHTPTYVKMFLRNKVPFDLARPWIEEKMTSHDAALNAANGLTPTFDADAWDATGLSDTIARSWYARVHCTPETAATLHSLGANPARVAKAIKRMPLTAFTEWACAGVTINTIANWYTDRVNLDDALAWQNLGLTPGQYRECGAVIARMRSGRHDINEQTTLAAAASMDPDTARAWLDAGIPATALPHAMATTTFTPAELAAWGGLPTGDLGHRTVSGDALNTWFTMMRAMPKTRYEQWRTHPVTSQWFAYPYQPLLDICMLDRNALGPEFVDTLDATQHRCVLRTSQFLTTLLNVSADPETVLAIAAAGWLSEDAVVGNLRTGHNPPYLLHRTAQTMLDLWKQDQTLTPTQVHRRLRDQ